MVIAAIHPAWKHADNQLTLLIRALIAHPSFKDLDYPEHQQHKDNAGYVLDFAKKTSDALQNIPPDLPMSHEKEWQELVSRCIAMDGMITDPEERLNPLTGQWPGSFSFQDDEKTVVKNLALGLLELEDE